VPYVQLLTIAKGGDSRY